MVFKRRDKRSYARMAAESLWPRGGWTRAFHYIKHRLNRLPDRPHRIARGIAAGVFISFTPLFGLHFFGAVVIAMALRGNIIAAILGTFAGNPITFPIIGYSSMKLGHWMLGTRFQNHGNHGLVEKFLQAGGDLKNNFLAIFTDAHSNWDGLANFFFDVFLPYLVGGIVPGIIAAVAAYYFSLPLITAYQNRRRKRIKERFDKLKAKIVHRADKV